MWPILRACGWLMVVVAVAVAVLFLFVGPTPPRRIELATGSETGAYHAFGERLAQRLAERGLEVDLVTTAGSVENLQLLRSDNNAVSVGLVQSGLVSSNTAPGDSELRTVCDAN